MHRHFIIKLFFTTMFLVEFVILTFSQKSFLNAVTLADSLYDLQEYENAYPIYYNSGKLEFGKGEISKTQYLWIQAAYCLNKQKKYNITSDSLSGWIATWEKNKLADAFLTAKAYTLKGVAHRNQNSYVKALYSYEKAIAMFERLDTIHSNLVFAYKNAAVIYLRQLNYDKTIAYLTKALNLDLEGDYTEDIYMNLASTYFFLQNYNDALKYCNLGYMAAKSPVKKAGLDFLVARIYMQMGMPKQAKKAAIAALAYYSQSDEDWLEFLQVKSILAQIFEIENEPEEGLQHWKATILEVRQTAKKKRREIADIVTSAGMAYKRQGQLDSALSHYQQALIQVFPHFNSTNIADNPDLKDVYTESWIMTAAARKAEALHLLYQQKGNIADLHNAAYCFDLSLAGVKQLHKSYGSENAKLYMGDYSHSYVEEAIEVNYQLYTLTGDQNKLQKIFSLMEQSKASVLSEAIQKNKALLLMGIPDSLLEQEQDLRITIADLTTQMQNTEVEGQDQQVEIEKLKSLLSDSQQKYERLLEKMKADYPNFRSYVEEMPLPSFEDVIGRLLNDKSQFMEYFYGEKALYCLTIGRNGASVFKVERNAGFDGLMQQYLSFFRNANAIATDPNGYLKTANELYNVLFSKAVQDANIKLLTLIIVPDGLLGYLPFDALVITDKGMTAGFGNVDFLIKKYGVRYGYSANVLLQQKGNRRQKGKLLRVMPRFSAGERQLSPLEYSDEETRGIRNWHTLDGALATKAGFKTLAEQCQLIHLSTHAESNSGNGEPHIELADGQLMLPELYALNLSAADLVVLSACETGLGKVEKGEGVMSLARGFAYAGASSLVASLWKVNERSTATLFAHFYQYLDEGKTKSEALRLAKLSLLENAGTNARQSPYYWAGFVFMGNDGEMDLPTDLTKWYIILPLAVVGLVGGIIYLRKRRRRLIA